MGPGERPPCADAPLGAGGRVLRWVIVMWGQLRYTGRLVRRFAVDLATSLLTLVASVVALACCIPLAVAPCCGCRAVRDRAVRAYARVTELGSSRELRRLRLEIAMATVRDRFEDDERRARAAARAQEEEAARAAIRAHWQAQEPAAAAGDIRFENPLLMLAARRLEVAVR